jgi:hypothetical protein
MRTRSSWVSFFVAVAIAIAPVAVRADLPSGANVFATLQQTLDTRSSKVGDSVLLIVTGVIPSDTPDAAALQGATIRGHVDQVYAATPTKKAYIGIAFDTITLTDGRAFPYPAKIVALQKKKSVNAMQAAGEVLGGMLVGGLVGGAAGGAGGAVGTAMGGMGGVVYASQMAANFKIPQNSTVKMRTVDVLATTAHPQAPAQMTPPMAPPPPAPLPPPPPPMPAPSPTH